MEMSESSLCCPPEEDTRLRLFVDLVSDSLFCPWFSLIRTQLSIPLRLLGDSLTSQLIFNLPQNSEYCVSDSHFYAPAHIVFTWIWWWKQQSNVSPVFHGCHAGIRYIRNVVDLFLIVDRTDTSQFVGNFFHRSVPLAPHFNWDWQVCLLRFSRLT